MSDRTHHTPTGDLMCPDPAAPAPPAGPTLFPPRDADDDAYRRWLLSSPWPEVVFAVAR